MTTDRAYHGSNFRVCEDGCTVVVDRTQVSLKESLLQTCTPLTLRDRFYEVELLEEMASDRYYMLGTNPASLRDGVVCSWDMRRSLRYRSFEGGIFTAGDGLRSDVLYGKKGDVITVYLEASFADKQLMNFFLNGRLVYRQWIHVSACDLCPAIGVSLGPAKFKVTWPGKNTRPRVDLDKIHSLYNWVGFRNIWRNDSTSTLELIDVDNQPRRAFNVQSPRPLNTDTYTYIEMEILTLENPEMAPSLGLTPAWASKFQYPGWKPGTIGYHADDGLLHFAVSASKESSVIKDARCIAGDRMGCGLVYTDCTAERANEEQTVLTYFTKNGIIVHMKTLQMPAGGFYPTVALCSIGDKVKVQSPAPPPSIPPKVLQELSCWCPVYTDFRFSETIRFIDYPSTESTERIAFNTQTGMFDIIQYIRPNEHDYYICQFEIENIDQHCKLEMGGASINIATQSEAHEGPVRLGIGKGSELQVCKGDKYQLTVRRVAPTVTWVTVQHNGTTVFRTEWFHCSRTPCYPTLCCLGGEATLTAVWPCNIEPPDTYSELANLLRWDTDPRVTVTKDGIICPERVERHKMHNVLAPYPVAENAPFYFELQASHSDLSMTLPGIGVTSGMCPLHCWDVIPWRDTATSIFYGSEGYYTTWKGTHTCTDRMNQVTSVGCAIIKKGLKFWMQFFKNGSIVASHELSPPIGGVYPVISIHPESTGGQFKVEITAVPESSIFVMSKPLNDNTGLKKWEDSDTKEVIQVACASENGIMLESQKQEKLSSVSCVYIIHGINDASSVQGMILRLRLKGYTVHSPIRTDTQEERLAQVEMAEVVVCVLSPSGITERLVEEEMGMALGQCRPLLPVLTPQVSWPPGGRLIQYAPLIERFGDIKLTITEPEIGTQDTAEIELALHKAIGVSMEPVVLGPNPNTVGGNSKTAWNKNGKFDISKVPAHAKYGENFASASKSCAIL